jgi:hypothetical protein
MVKSITTEQLEEIEDALFCLDRVGAYELLKEYTGIEAKPYTAWSFYDQHGNCVGDSDNYSIRDLLENAYIDVIEEGVIDP